MVYKRSVSLSEATFEFAQRRFDLDKRESGLSPVVNGAFLDLEVLLNLARPDLDTSEWRHLIEYRLEPLMSVSLTKATEFSLASLLMNQYGVLSIEDAPAHRQQTIRRLAELTKAEQFAVADVLRRFWRLKDCGYFDEYNTDFEALLEILDD